MRVDGGIGLYDSGVGGLTVVRQLAGCLPCESMVYFGDTARVPYGGRTAGEIVRFGREICSYLLDQGVKLILVACNTSSALALEALAAETPVPLLDVLSAGARAAAGATISGRIGVLATHATAASGAYERAIHRRLPEADVHVAACPALVPLIEEGRLDGSEVREALADYLRPLQAAHIDTVVYGCTHYPFLDRLVAEIAGPDVTRVDPAAALARQVEDFLRQRGAAAVARMHPDRFAVSGSTERFRALGSILLGRALPPVERININGYGGVEASRPSPGTAGQRN